MKIESREYKLLIDHRPFVATNAAVNGVWAEIEDATRTAPFVIKEGLKEEESRTVCFLDTPDHTLRRHRLVLRRPPDDRSTSGGGDALNPSPAEPGS